jgi:hypothetical protein
MERVMARDLGSRAGALFFSKIDTEATPNVREMALRLSPAV